MLSLSALLYQLEIGEFTYVLTLNEVKGQKSSLTFCQR